VINGQAHGPDLGTATCQLHMRSFRDGDTLVIEPWRARAFPVIRDLVVDRGALDRIIAAGGYTGAKTGGHVDANAILIPKDKADLSMDAAACIGCGACVAACPNASASLFTAAKISQMALLPQGEPLRHDRVTRMVGQMDKEGFGGCTNIGECRAACPKDISIDTIARMRREYVAAMKAPARRTGGDGAI
jgi:succinate dehydrogenase / fumarate reductase iron-sulfur subunit